MISAVFRYLMAPHPLSSWIFLSYSSRCIISHRLLSSPHLVYMYSNAKVRARLEKKLQVRQKTGFAFNFAIDSDADQLQKGEACGRGDAEERGSFRFDFNPTNTSVGADTSSTESKERSSGGGINPRAVQDFVVEMDTRRPQTNGNKNKKKKGAGKKNKGTKGKGKPVGHGLGGLAEEQQPQVTTPPTVASSTVGSGANETNNYPPLAAASDSGPKPNHAQPGASAAQGFVQQNEVGEKTALEKLRPPPGFTLESWKDPTLSGEERRRRRFGSGVRNMAAIQRSSDARRVLVANRELKAGECPGRHGGLLRPDRDRARADATGLVNAGIPGDITSGGSSVFAFGFDIGISFNDGS